MCRRLSCLQDFRTFYIIRKGYGKANEKGKYMNNYRNSNKKGYYNYLTLFNFTIIATIPY